jgi:hypothetical protein
MTLVHGAVLRALLLLASLTSCTSPAATRATPSLSPNEAPSAPPTSTAARTASPSPSQSPSTYTNATLAYGITLPAGYRPSSCASWVDARADPIGVDYFTRLSDHEELQLNIHDIPPAERASDFHVVVHRESRGRSVVEWARAQPVNTGASVEAMTIGGREAAKITSSDRMAAVSFAIRSNDRIYVLDNDIRREGGDSAAFLAPIGASFTPIAPGPLPTPYTKEPRDAAQELATALAKAFTERDAVGVAIRMRGCTLGMSAIVEPPQPNNTCCTLNRAIFPFIEALRPALASGTVTVVVEPMIRSSGRGGREQFFAVSRWTENGKARQIDLLFDERGGQWYWLGAIHHFQRTDGVCYGSMWGGGPPC